MRCFISTSGPLLAMVFLAIGVALGAAIAGFVIDEYDVHTGFMVALLSSVFVLLTALFVQKLHKQVDVNFV